MLTYSEAHQMMQTARNGRRKLARNTYLRAGDGTPDREGNAESQPGEYVIRYHGTDIARIGNDGTYTLNSGGWRTFTTKERLNRFTPARIYSDRGMWLITSDDDPRTAPKIQKCRICHGTGLTQVGPVYSYGDYKPGTYEFVRYDTPKLVQPAEDRTCYQCKGEKVYDYGSKRNPVRFFDGITVQQNGKPAGRNLKRQHDHTRDDKFNASMRRKIAKYTAGYTDEKIQKLYQDAAEYGTAGDCWFCSMFDREPTREQKADPYWRGGRGNVAPSAGDHSHLIDHIDEGYYMATLMHNAVSAKGYPYPEVIIATSGRLTRDAVGQYLRKRLLRNVDTR